MAITSGFNFWNPESDYNWQGAMKYYGSPIEHTQANQNPDAAYLRAITQQGYGGLDANSDFARSLQSRVLQGWQAAKLTNPELGVEDFLSGLGPDWVKHVAMGMDPQSRGIQERPYVGGARWLKRQ